jgi:predicted transcriptional regulator
MGVSPAELAIRDQARARVAQVFGLTPDAVPQGAEFGKDLKATFSSDFRFNEFDKIDQDIKDVADRATRKRLASGDLVIRTVADYCDHMVVCYATNPRDVVRVLGLEGARSVSDAG